MENMESIIWYKQQLNNLCNFTTHGYIIHASISRFFFQPSFMCSFIQQLVIFFEPDVILNPREKAAIKIVFLPEELIF